MAKERKPQKGAAFNDTKSQQTTVSTNKQKKLSSGKGGPQTSAEKKTFGEEARPTGGSVSTYVGGGLLRGEKIQTDSDPKGGRKGCPRKGKED